MTTDPVKHYINTLNEIRSRGNATELSYREALADLFRALDPKKGMPISVINEPKRR